MISSFNIILVKPFFFTGHTEHMALAAFVGDQLDSHCKLDSYYRNIPEYPH